MSVKKKTKTKKTKAIKKPRYKYLVIVESPAKSKTIEKYLGKDYKVVASMGHLRDLPKSRMAIDIENNFEPYYCIVKGRMKQVKELREYARVAEKVFLAPDPDREGEAIAWHLVSALELVADRFERIEFNEITKTAVVDSFGKARNIDMHRVDAQQARRCLDRLVGYKLSPLLWKRVKRGLSAGRVQSAALHIMCQREEEISVFIPREYWQIAVNYEYAETAFTAKVVGQKNIADFDITNAAAAHEVEAVLQREKSTVTNVIRKERRRNPYAPFITSTLQQDAYNRLGFNTRKTMMIAQQLYEGVDIGGSEGPVGLITYMRTDSTRTAVSALEELQHYIINKLGAAYKAEQVNIFKQKKAAQDAHEAIRPSSVLREPELLESFLSPDQFKLYRLIWRRFVASQMAAAVYDQTSIELAAGEYNLRASGSIVKFPGFLKVYEVGDADDDKSSVLPDIPVQSIIPAQSVDKKQCFTQAPPRYTEASLVKTLEEMGIGRPSTYAPIISTLQLRNYVRKEGKTLIPTELGIIVDKQMAKHFPEIVDVGFTASMEDKLDQVEEGTVEWKKMLHEFYGPFELEIKKAEELMEDMRVPDRPSNEVCDKCGKSMVIKSGRFGDFLACTGFPECKTTKTILKTLEDIYCPLCGAPVAERKSKKGRLFYGCTAYPDCTFATWDKPLKENCEKCSSFLIEKKDKETGLKVKVCIKCDISATAPLVEE